MARDSSGRRPQRPDLAIREAAIGYADADTDSDYKRASDRLRKVGIWTGEAALRRAAQDDKRHPTERQVCARAAEVLRRIRRGSST